ncbi:alpha/beta hydrolase [Azonexus sp.]|uniref:alpha/beta hydrolase n=1 Tax=Azonexus sp. TaxID=1872668 RepID=UPI0027B917F4|nr:alpha/beta hydrolase [Azonexus sp.]
MQRHHIQINNYPAVDGPQRGALLFVHGAYTHSSYWEFNFIPFFRQQGFDCFSLDLSGHGASEGAERLDEFGIDDYAEDIAHAVSRIDQPVTIVAHSMGCLATQRYLEQGSARAAVFLAPVPVTGTTGSAAQLAMRFPRYFAALDEVVSGIFSEENNDLMAKIYFSPDATGDDVLAFLPTVGPESQQAVMEMAMLATRPLARRQKLPVLVIGGEADAIFPPSHLFFVALPWQANVIRVPQAGHMLPIDSNWQTVAQHILEWVPEN